MVKDIAASVLAWIADGWQMKCRLTLGVTVVMLVLLTVYA